MATVIFGAPNWAYSQNASIDASTAGVTAATSMPFDNLLTPEPSERARVENTSSKYSSYLLRLGTDSGEIIGALGSGRGNLTKNATVRWRIADSTQPPAWQRMAPTAVEASTNLTVSLADIDEHPDAPDGAWATAVSGVDDTDLRVSFGSPSSDCAVGGVFQVFRAYVRYTGTISGGAPTMNIELWEAGAKVSDVRMAISITSSSGQYVEGYWNADLLSDPTGADVEVKLVSTASAGATVEYGAVDWLQEPIDTGNISYDSGWVSIPYPEDSTYLQNSSLSDLSDQPEIYFWDVLATPVTDAVSVRLDVRDHENPDGYIDLGIFCCGPALSFSLGADYGYQENIDRGWLRADSILGGSYEALTYSRSQLSGVQLVMTRPEAGALRNRVLRTSTPIYFILETDDAAGEQDGRVLWAVVDRASGPEQIGSSVGLGVEMYQATLDLVEKL